MRTWAAATMGAPNSAYIPASEPKHTIMAMAEWMTLRSVTTAAPAPTTPAASRTRRTLEMSRVKLPHGSSSAAAPLGRAPCDSNAGIARSRSHPVQSADALIGCQGGPSAGGLHHVETDRALH